MMIPALILSVGASIWLVRRGGFLSPTAVLAATLTLQLAVFYVVAVQGVYPERIDRAWQVTNDYDSVAPGVAVGYLGMIALCVIASFVSGERRSAKRARRLEVRDGDQLSRLLDPYLVSGPALVVTIWAIALLGVHAVLIDRSQVLLHFEYLAIRDPEVVGLRPGVMAFVHRNIPMLGVLFGPLVGYYWARRHWLFCALSAVVFLYCGFITLAFGSRFVVVQLAGLAIALYLMGSVRLRRFALAIVIVIALVYPPMMELRRGQEHGISAFGRQFSRQPLPTSDLALFAIFNFSIGGFVFADALDQPPVDYPWQYKMLSFSPFPSFLDGFGSFRHFEHRVTAISPFSNLAEAYHFGVPWLVAFVLCLFVVLVVMARFWSRFHGGGALLVMLPTHYALLRMHSYPIRHTWRWLVFSVVMTLVIGALFEKQRAGKSAYGRPSEEVL